MQDAGIEICLNGIVNVKLGIVFRATLHLVERTAQQGEVVIVIRRFKVIEVHCFYV